MLLFTLFLVFTWLLEPATIILSEPASGLPAQTGQSKEFHLHGEYGLFVRELPDSIEVNWITENADSGFLEVFVEGEVRHEAGTPLSRAHTAKVAKKNYRNMVLRYGGRQNPEDSNWTTIRLPKKKKKAKAVFNDVDSIFVVGDVHGRFIQLRQLLTNAGVIDKALNWTGGRAHLVLLGDLFDRGHDVTRLLWFLYNIEYQAQQRGGRVHLVLGNHEIMTIVDDLRYLSGKERLIADYHRTTYAKLFDIYESVLGKWLSTKPALLKINNVLFAHGGVTPNYAHYTVNSYNEALFSRMREPIFFDLLQDSVVTAQYDSETYENRLAFFFGNLSPFWFRGYVLSDTLGKYLKYVLTKFDANIHVVAHTPVKSIAERYNGDLIAVDLQDAATEMLLLVRHKRKSFKRFRYDINGRVTDLE